MLNKLDYLYNGEESLLNRINPVIKIFGLFIYLIIMLLKFNRLLFIINIGFIFLLILLSNIKITKYLKIIWKFKFIIILMYAYMYHKQMELIDMNIIVFKILFFILYFMIIIYTTNREELGKGVSVIINRVNVIGLSIKSIALFVTNIFVFIEYFIDSYNEFFRKIEIEGISYFDTNIINKVVLFIKNIKKIFILSLNKMKIRNKDLKYRLYNKNVISKFKYRNRLCIFDYLYVLMYIGMIVYYILKVR